MNTPEPMNQHNFLYPRSTYRGHFTPEALVFNANLQEFGQKVGYISSLHTNGKLSAQEAYEKLDNLWEQLQQSKKAMQRGLT